MHKVEHNRVPEAVATLFNRVAGYTPKRYSQTSGVSIVPMTCNIAGQRTLCYRGAKAWQYIPVALQNCTSVKEFQDNLQKSPAGPAICPLIIYTAAPEFYAVVLSNAIVHLQYLMFTYYLPKIYDRLLLF